MRFWTFSLLVRLIFAAIGLSEFLIVITIYYLEIVKFLRLMKFSGVFVVAEVCLTAKLEFSVFVGIEWICKRAKIADLFAKIFIPFNVPPECGYFLQKRIFGVFIYGKLKGGLLDFLDSFTEVYWTFAVLSFAKLTKVLLFALLLRIAITSKAKL